ncbi:hypothetical protein IWX50DRAFT_557897, partial [Phyllosticta citricarpa]
DIPQLWCRKWTPIELRPPPRPSGRPLQEQLEEISSANGKTPGLSREEMANVGELIGKMLRIDPSERASAAELLEDPWFRDAQC